MEPLTPRTPDGGDSGTDAELGTMHSGSISRGSSMTDMQCAPPYLCSSSRTAKISRHPAHGLGTPSTCTCPLQVCVTGMGGAQTSTAGPHQQREGLLCAAQEHGLAVCEHGSAGGPGQTPRLSGQ